MKHTKFIKLFNARYANNRKLINPENINWKYLKLIKAGSERINYHCDFKNGVCFERRHHSSNKDVRNKMCCCIDCFRSIGHFRYLQQDNEAEMKMLAENFIEPKDSTMLTNSGFWKVKEGCILPRMYRSIVCLRHFCNSTMMSRIDLFYLDQILSAFNYEKVQNKLVRFMAKENNDQFLPFDQMSSSQKKLAINILWKFAKQEFLKYEIRKSAVICMEKLEKN